MAFKHLCAIFFILLNKVDSAQSADCNFPDDVPNANLVTDIAGFDHFTDNYYTLQYDCDVGYRALAGRQRVCKDGEWTPITCIPPSCPDFDPPIYNGMVHHDDYDLHEIGHVAQIECNEDSDMFPEDFDGFVFCLGQDKWSVNTIACERHMTVQPLRNMYMYKVTNGNQRELVLAYRSVQSRTRLHVRCSATYELYDGQAQSYMDKRSHDLTVFNGTYVPGLPICKKKRCALLPGSCSYTDSDGNALSGKVAHNTTVVKTCDINYEFVPGVIRNYQNYTETCNEGYMPLPECILKRCQIPVGRQTNRKGPGDLVRSGKTERLVCQDTEELYYPESGTYADAKRFETTCELGKWTSPIFPKCEKKRCPAEEHTGTLFLLDGMEVQPGNKLEDGTSLVKVCLPGYENNNEAQPRCDGGVWHDSEPCTPFACVLPAVVNSLHNAESTDLQHDDEITLECENNYDLLEHGAAVPIGSVIVGCNLGNVTQYMENYSCEPKGCTTDPNANVYRTDNTGNVENDTAMFFDHNQLASMQCKEHFFMYKDREVVAVAAAKMSTRCSLGNWNPLYSCEKESCIIDLPAHSLLEADGLIQTGNVTIESGSEGRLSCQQKYILYNDPSATVYDHYPIACVGQHLNASLPSCVENNESTTVKLPCDNLLIYQACDVVIPEGTAYAYENGSVIETKVTVLDGTKVKIICEANCTLSQANDREDKGQTVIQKCKGGELTRKYESNCPEGCHFGGTCWKDGKCKCALGYSGTNCETPVCNVQCKVNGGTCVGPNRCQCEEPRYGHNCETVGCTQLLLPEYMSIKGPDVKTSFEIGDILSRDQLTCANGYLLSTTKDMVCIEGSVWSGQAECINETRYTMELTVGSGLWGSSYDPLYVTLINQQGETISTIAYAKPMFTALYREATYTSIGSTVGYLGKVDAIRIALGAPVITKTDNIQINRIRLTVERGHTIEEYIFSSVGWVNEIDKPLTLRPDEDAEVCTAPNNARIVKGYFYTVICDDSYVLNTIENDHNYKCTDGKLLSYNYKREPICDSYDYLYDYDYYGYNGADIDDSSSEDAEVCTAPSHASIVKGYLYTVICDDGYVLNTIENDHNYKCTDGKLLSDNYKREPICVENAEFSVVFKMVSDYAAWTGDSILISFHGDLGHSDSLTLSSGPIYKRMQYSKTLNDGYVGEINSLELSKNDSLGMGNDAQFDYIHLTVSSGGKKEQYMFTDVGWLENTKVLKPDPGCLPPTEHLQLLNPKHHYLTYEEIAPRDVQCQEGYVKETRSITCMRTGHWSRSLCKVQQVERKTYIMTTEAFDGTRNSISITIHGNEGSSETLEFSNIGLRKGVEGQQAWKISSVGEVDYIHVILGDDYQDDMDIKYIQLTVHGTDEKYIFVAFGPLSGTTRLTAIRAIRVN